MVDIYSAKYKDCKAMMERFKQEYYDGCSTLNKSGNKAKKWQSVLMYGDYFVAHWDRMIDEIYGRDKAD